MINCTDAEQIILILRVLYINIDKLALKGPLFGI